MVDYHSFQIQGETFVSKLWADSGVSVADFTSQDPSRVFGKCVCSIRIVLN